MDRRERRPPSTEISVIRRKNYEKGDCGRCQFRDRARVGKKTLDCIKPIENFNEFREFFDEAANLIIPDFMNVKFT